MTQPMFTDAADFGFAPESGPMENAKALQRAVDCGGTVVVGRPGIYDLGGTVYVGSDTTLIFGNGIFIRKVAVEGVFTHVLLNKGALTKRFDENIVVEGLHIMVNGVDKAMSEVYGLRGQLAFFYVKDLRIQRFRCHDLEKSQFAIHVCTFEDLIVDDVIIKGDKDGIHLGRGKRFTIRNGIFQTVDDAVALNAHDYATSNPELGWIEDGVVQNCHDLRDTKQVVGYFCRILAGGWIDWQPGMQVQHSDSVVANGRLYRVQAKPDDTVYTSVTRPDHAEGSRELDGIRWGVVQDDVTHTAGVRNVVFRDIVLEKPRPAFSVHFDCDRYSRSYYPGAEIPTQKQLLLDNVRVKHDQEIPLVTVGTPVDVLTVANSSLNRNRIEFHCNKAMEDYGRTQVNMLGCVFTHDGPTTVLENNVGGKQIVLNSTANIATGDRFKAEVRSADDQLAIRGHLPG